MNRRKAIRRIFWVGGGAVGIYAGWKGVRLFGKPDVKALLDQRALVAELAETIIPRTDTPGAKDAGVGDFIIKMVMDCTGRTAQNNFVYGLDDLQSYTRDQFDRPFEKCDTAQREAVLHHFEKTDSRSGSFTDKVKNRLLGASFFDTLKRYTVMGYCSSEIGATEALEYDYIPGEYISTTLAPGQRAWATR